MMSDITTMHNQLDALEAQMQEMGAMQKDILDKMEALTQAILALHQQVLKPEEETESTQP